MGLIWIVLSSIVFIICLYGYLKVVYECVRKVRIKNTENLSNKKTASVNKCVEEKNAAKINVNEYKQAPGPLPWPILGNLALLGRYDVPFQGFTELAKQFGNVYSLTLGTTRCLIVNNLDLIREVLNQNGKYFGGRPDFLRFHVLFGGNRNNSLALCDWSQLQQKRRNLARKHCSPRDATSFYQKMSDVGCYEMQEFLDRLSATVKKDGEEIALKPLVQQTCANMFSQYMCSIRFDYDDKEFQYIVRCFDEIFWEINQGYAVDFLPWLSPFYANHMKKIVHWSNTIRKFILERIINDRERNVDAEAPERDFTDALLKSLGENDDVSRDTIIYMLEDFIGGHSAIGNLVMLALAYIVKNPETGKKIQAEVDNILSKNQRFISLMDTDNMPYTVGTIYEVLRYCSSPIVPHVATEDVAIGGYGVTKGTIVFINNYELNTSPKYWNEPEKFNPERFILPLNPPKIDPVTKNVQHVQLKKNIPHFLPFSIGKRTCIGQNLVKGFGFIMLANIMHKFDISSKDLSQIKTYPACVAVPPDTFLLTLKPRSP
ncbi:cytochrome P450 307a1-like [Lucilia sericata]|uniref:cytochrome P450 307a1-like n=1 Tax=Lucilia sericata TaxID=13632 RepID=UPI0018A85AB9|nr:cytochrome P450 307a1-like [Lucilia sericata]